jgi:hypothetical protein
LVASLRRPTAGSFAVLIGIGAVLIALSMLLQRFLGESHNSDVHEGAPSDTDTPRASDEAERAQRFRERSGMPRDASGQTSSRRPDKVSS